MSITPSTTTKRRAFYVDQTMTGPDGQYVAALIDEGEAGYYSTTYTLGTDFEKAKAAVATMNEAWGLTPEDATAIVASSFAAHNREHPFTDDDDEDDQPGGWRTPATHHPRTTPAGLRPARTLPRPRSTRDHHRARDHPPR